MIRKDVTSLSAREREQYVQIHQDFISNTTALQDHTQWHMDHMPPNDPGNGRAFLLFHRRFIRRFERYATLDRARNLVPLAYWNPGTPVPEELRSGITHPNPAMPLPSWATVRGGSQKAPLFGYTRLEQFKNADELGRALVDPYHDEVHVALGGLMARITSSPRAPIFFLWHAFLDDVFASWQELAGDRRLGAARKGAEPRPTA